MKISIPTLLFLVLMVSCELFIPRDSEPPLNTNDLYAWKPPTTPEIVLENLSNAFPALKRNYHLDVLSHDPESAISFEYIPDPGVAALQPGIFTVWGYAEEDDFITKLFQSLNEDGIQRLEWDVQQLLPASEKYEIIADYQLNLSYLDGNTHLPGQLKGQATLTLVQNSDQLYEVSSWQDVKVPSDTTACWTDLKTLVQ